MLVYYPCIQHMTKAIWRSRVVKGWTLGPGPLQSAMEDVPPHNMKKRREISGKT